MTVPWLDQHAHSQWLAAEHRALLDFGRRVARPGGGASDLGDDGTPDHSVPLTPFATARVAHAYGMGALAGIPGARTIASEVLAGLTGPLHDDEHGGWFHRGEPSLDASKGCYDHVHVLLGASTALLLGLPCAQQVYEEAASLVVERFWDDDLGVLRDGFDRSWTVADDYIGANANMHGLEALLAAYDVSGEQSWLDKGLRIVDFFAAAAEAQSWRMPEHYAPDGAVRLDLNQDRPADRFKPYGATIGHGFEWSRLVLHLAAALSAAGRPSERLAIVAASLFDRATADGWAVDGAPGFVYTVDFDGTPVTRTRLWWVAAEATNAAACLYRRTGERRYADLYETWWDFIATCHRDVELGSWFHELDERNRVGHTIWNSKADLYHTTQATLVPRLPLYPGMSRAIAEGLLGTTS